MLQWYNLPIKLELFCKQSCVQLRLMNAGECSGMWVLRMQRVEVNDLVIRLIVPDWLKVFNF